MTVQNKCVNADSSLDIRNGRCDLLCLADNGALAVQISASLQYCRQTIMCIQSLHVRILQVVFHYFVDWDILLDVFLVSNGVIEIGPYNILSSSLLNMTPKWVMNWFNSVPLPRKNVDHLLFSFIMFFISLTYLDTPKCVFFKCVPYWVWCFLIHHSYPA